jgi:hypothetical protein
MHAHAVTKMQLKSFYSLLYWSNIHEFLLFSVSNNKHIHIWQVDVHVRDNAILQCKFMCSFQLKWDDKHFGISSILNTK